MSFKNGEIARNRQKGWKAFSTNKNLAVNDILYCVYGGPSHARGSFQTKLKTGDMVFKLVWSSNKKGETEDKYQVFEVFVKKGEAKLSQVPPIEAGPLWKKMEKQNPWAKDWLQPFSEKGAFLPPEAGPVVSEVRKWKNWIHFLQKYGPLDQYVDYHAIDNGPRFCVQLSNNKGLNYDPKKLDFDPDTVIASSMEDPDDLNGQHTHTLYFLSDGRGHLFDPRHEDLNAVGLRKWRSHRYIVKLVIGAYSSIKDGSPRTHGVTVDVYHTSDAH